LQNKKTRPDPNLWAINLKLWQVVGNIVVYKSYKFQIDSIKIEAYLIQNAEELLRIKKTRPDLNFWAINLQFLQGVGKIVVYNP